LSPIFVGLAAVLLGRAHYVLYVLKRGNRTSAVFTWAATIAVLGFWVWKWSSAL
jgi:hypothetical protein